jgi:hypothetical protein
LLGGIFLFAGYFGSWMTFVKRPVSNELIRFHRREQMIRLRELISNKLTLNRKMVIHKGAHSSER